MIRYLHQLHLCTFKTPT